MSQFETELCSLLIEDSYGELFSHIFSTLTLHGRLTLPDLAKHTRLSPRHVKPIVAALIQAHLVLHYTDSSSQTFYSANIESAYSLLRSGRILRTVEDRLGGFDASILLQILLLGHAKASHLATLPCIADAASKKLSNGDSIPNPHDLLVALQRLSDAGFIKRVRMSHFRSNADNHNEAERHVQATMSGLQTKGKKAQQDFDRLVDNELRKRKESTFPRSSFHTQQVSGAKRGFDGCGDRGQHKKQKLANGVTSEACGSEEMDLGPAANLIMQVNHSKFAVLMRNQRLVALAEQCVGRASAKLYRAALQQAEPRLQECREKNVLLPAGEASDYTSPNIDVANLVQNLEPKIRLDGTIAHWNPKQNGTNGTVAPPIIRRKRPPDWEGGVSDEEHDGDVDEHGNISGVEHESADDTANRDFRLSASRHNGAHVNGLTSSYEKVLQHLHLLAEAPEEFVTLEYDDQIPRWRIDYQNLAAELRNQQVFSIIADQFGNYALRLVRVLMDKGKLDEKSLQEIVLMSAKDLRRLLAKLKAAGFLELQEVPRENQRQPSRTIYLWFYDDDRVRRKVLEDTYKSMTRVLQRLRVERKKVRGVLDKAERTDVKGHEEEYLAAGELRILGRWRKMEEAMWGEVGRLDDLVAIMRDF